MGLRNLLKSLSDLVASESSLPNVYSTQKKIDPLNAKLEENLLPGFKEMATKPVSMPDAYVPPSPDQLSTLIQPLAMPSPNSPGVQQARRKSLKQQLTRRGRLSTILTEADDSLGAAG